MKYVIDNIFHVMLPPNLCCGAGGRAKDTGDFPGSTRNIQSGAL
jgi:hypothetical protein